MQAIGSGMYKLGNRGGDKGMLMQVFVFIVTLPCTMPDIPQLLQRRKIICAQ